MSGIGIVGSLLHASAPLIAQVPAERIDAWRLSQGAGVPSIVITRVSRTKRQFLSAQAVWMMTERVQVTVRASNGEQRETIIDLIERACADRIGTIAGFASAAVLLAGTGPDFMDDAASIFMGSTDLRVSFNKPA